MKTRILSFLIAAMLLAGYQKALAQLPVYIDISTGLYNNTTTQIPFGQPDDTWQEYDPITQTASQSWVANGNFFGPDWDQSSPCGNWITRFSCLNQNNNNVLNCNPGASNTVYTTYRTTFTLNSTCMTNVSLVLNAIAVDDGISFELNGFPYSAGPFLSSCMPGNQLAATSMVIPINPAHLVAGTNTLDAIVCDSKNYTGFLLCGYFYGEEISMTEDLDLTVNANSVYCSPTPSNPFPVGVNATTSATNVTNHQWQLIECTAAGVPVAGGYNWSSNWIAGPIGGYTFSQSPYPPCDKYYLVKAVIMTPCTPWYEATSMIYLSCTPQFPISGPTNLCYGQTVTYCVTGLPQGTMVLWSNGMTGDCITIAPTASSTLSATVVNSYGCSNTVPINITVDPGNNPSFSLNANIAASGTYYTCTATPLVMTNLPAGFGYAWYVEELDAAGNPTMPNTLVCNPSCWWTPSMSTNFNGYDGFNNSAYNCNATLNCSSPPAGQFVNCKKYRVRRATWSTSCPWVEKSVVAYLCQSPRTGELEFVTEDEDGTVTRQPVGIAGSTVTPTFEVMPNPNNGQFTIRFGENVTEGTAALFNVMGECVKTMPLNGGNSFLFDSEGVAAGIYLLRVTTAAGESTQRVIIE